MAKDIDVPLVRECLNNFVGDISQIKSLFDKVQTNYIKECGVNVWNTPAAYDYMEKLCISFNDYISQFNKFFKEGYTAFLTDANIFFRSQHASTVEEQEIVTISDLSVNWEKKEEKFKVPDPGEVESLTKTDLTATVVDIWHLLDDMCNMIDTACNSGMSDDFCCDDRDNIKSLTGSAQTVAMEYSGKAAEAAANADENVQKFRSQK